LNATAFKGLLAEVRSCRLCETLLPLGPRPILRALPTARLLIVGQAPGRKVHETGIPWNDPSGDRLRSWLQLTREEFYDETRIAIIPTGLCYPGKLPGRGGDCPPRPECAPKWHPPLRAALPEIRLTLLIGGYAQAFYLRERVRESLAETVAAWREFVPEFLPLPHPSPRNLNWFRRHPWFEAEVVPELRRRVREILAEE
jgi:uracil-DNA glycosylase